MEKENILRSDFILASAAQFTISFVVFLLVPKIPIYLASFKAKEAEIGFLVGSLSVSSLVLRPFVGRALLKIPERRFMMTGAFLYVIAMVILAFSSTLPMFILVSFLWGAGNAFVFPCLLVYALERAGASRGPAMGTFTAVAGLGSGVGPMMMGVVLQNSSYVIMFLCLALTGVINFLYFYRLTGELGGNRNANL